MLVELGAGDIAVHGVCGVVGIGGDDLGGPTRALAPGAVELGRDAHRTDPTRWPVDGRGHGGVDRPGHGACRTVAAAPAGPAVGRRAGARAVAGPRVRCVVAQYLSRQGGWSVPAGRLAVSGVLRRGVRVVGVARCRCSRGHPRPSPTVRGAPSRVCARGAGDRHDRHSCGVLHPHRGRGSLRISRVPPPGTAVVDHVGVGLRARHRISGASCGHSLPSAGGVVAHPLDALGADAVAGDACGDPPFDPADGRFVPQAGPLRGGSLGRVAALADRAPRVHASPGTQGLLAVPDRALRQSRGGVEDLLGGPPGDRARVCRCGGVGAAQRGRDRHGRTERPSSRAHAGEGGTRTSHGSRPPPSPRLPGLFSPQYRDRESPVAARSSPAACGDGFGEPSIAAAFRRRHPPLRGAILGRFGACR